MVENQLGWYFQNLYNWKWLEIIMSNHPFSTGWPWPWGSRMSSLLFGGNGQFGGSSPKDFFTPEIFTPKKIHCERTLRISSELYITNQLFSTYTYSVRSVWIYVYIYITACISVSKSMMFFEAYDQRTSCFSVKEKKHTLPPTLTYKWKMGPSNLILCDHAPLTSPSTKLLNGCWSDDNPT